MHIVDLLFQPYPRFQTELWISEHAAEALDDFVDETNEGPRFYKKLSFWAEAGFPVYERKGERPIRREENGVYRVGAGLTLFRLYGFYDKGKRNFIAIDAVHKRKTKLSSAERTAIRSVARVRDDEDWEYRDE